MNTSLNTNKAKVHCSITADRVKLNSPVINISQMSLVQINTLTQVKPIQRKSNLSQAVFEQTGANFFPKVEYKNGQLVGVGLVSTDDNLTEIVLQQGLKLQSKKHHMAVYA